MSFFKQVEGEAAIIITNGVYRQCDLYTRDGYLYAKVGGGFVRLMADGATTKSKTRLDFMSWNGRLCRDAVGRLCTSDAPEAMALETPRAKLLLGAPST